MGSISAGDLLLLRARQDIQKTIEKLYVWGFPEMWRGLVNDLTIERGDQTVAYDTGVLQGDFAFADITEGLMVWFGTSAGSDDLGRRMLLSITGTASSGSMVIDWYDDMELSDGDHITIIHFRPPWPKLSWFSTADGFYKSGPPAGEGGAGINYSDQNEDPPPLVVMGRCAVSDDGSAIAVDASDSQAVATGATISTYAWTYTPSGATASFANAAIAATTFTPTTKTHYYLKCTITDNNGKTAVGYRPFIANDAANDEAITEFSRTAITEQYNSFSVGCSLTLTSPDIGNAEADNPQVDWSDIDSGVMVIITADDFYGTTEKNITFRDDSRYDDRKNIVYCGFVIQETRNFGADTASIQLTCVNAVQFFLYSLSLTGVRSATDWYEMNSDLMYVASLLFHLFRWQSTLLEISDWILLWSDTTLRSAVEEWTEGNIMDRARSLAGEHGRLMAITATSQGEFFVEEDANLISAADRNALTTTLTMDNDDVIQARQVKINHRPQISQVYVSGGNSDGVLGTFEPFLSISQNVRKAQGVGAQNFERLMLPDQTEANRLCGRILAVLNREKVEIDLTFAGIYREVFSPTDSQWVNTGTEIWAAGEITNLRGSTDLNSIRLIPRQVVKRPPTGGYAGVDVVFDVEAPAGELTGRTITLLPVDPFYVPPDVNTQPPMLGEPIDALLTSDDTNGVEVYIFDDATWASRNTGLSGDDLKVRDLKVVPYWWLFQNSTDHEDCMLWIATDGGIFFSNDFGKSWLNRTPLAALDSAPAGVTPETVAYHSIDVFSVPTDINRTITAQCREEVAGVISSWLLISTNSGFSWASSKRS